MNIILASDHAGFAHKESLKNALEQEGHTVQDMGAPTEDPADDYPGIIAPAAQAIVQTPGTLGIILGGSGQGEAIVANKTPGIRAVVYYGGPQEILTLSKEHNNANVLSLGARFLTEEETITAAKLWIATTFKEEERHKRRLKEIEDLEAQQ